jgi:hypothetical protein
MSQWYPKLAEFDFEDASTTHTLQENFTEFGATSISITIDKEYL